MLRDIYWVYSRKRWKKTQEKYSTMITMNQLKTLSGNFQKKNSFLSFVEFLFDRRVFFSFFSAFCSCSALFWHFLFLYLYNDSILASFHQHFSFRHWNFCCSNSKRRRSALQTRHRRRCPICFYLFFWSHPLCLCLHRGSGPPHTAQYTYTQQTLDRRISSIKSMIFYGVSVYTISCIATLPHNNLRLLDLYRFISFVVVPARAYCCTCAALDLHSFQFQPSLCIQ